MEDGIYRSKDAVYFIKGSKIIMQLMGRLYKTTESFMQGIYQEPLNEAMIEGFDEQYADLKSW